MKALIVASSGGHLAQLTSLDHWWRQVERRWVTFDTDDATSALADETVAWAHHPTTRNVPNTLRNGALAIRLLRDYHPDVVISTGAGVAFPFFVAARAMRIRTCYIEVLDRVHSRTLTGRLCYPIADAFFVQWEEQLALYPEAEVLGLTL